MRSHHRHDADDNDDGQGRWSGFRANLQLKRKGMGYRSYKKIIAALKDGKLQFPTKLKDLISSYY